MLDIIEIRSRSPQGATQPFICRAQDNEVYYVKGNTALGSGRIAELVCAELAKELSLPVPDFKIVNIPEELIEFDIDLQFDLGSGAAFASQQIEHPQEINTSSLQLMSSGLLEDIFIFDYWVKNLDRTGSVRGGNSNLIYQTRNRQLYVIDHNLAFDENFELEEFRQTHICSNAWYSRQNRLFTRENYENRLQSGIAKLPTIFQSIPNEWLNCSTIDENFLPRLRGILEAPLTDIFWEDLK